MVSQYKGGVKLERAPEQNLHTTKIVVASREIPFGTKVIKDYLTYTEWPNESVPTDSFKTMDEVLKDANGSDEERVALAVIYVGEPLTRKKVSGFGVKPTLSRKVADGMRAYSISINDVSGVAGFLLPGDKVDVLLTRRPAQGNNDDLITDVILQNVVVLGIDQLADEQRDKPVIARTATVEVTPEDAQKLALAQQIGTLSLALRGYTNNEEAPVAQVSIHDLTNDGPIEPAAGGGGYRGLVVRRGTKMSYSNDDE